MDKRLHYLWVLFPDAQHNIFSMQCNIIFYLTQSVITTLPRETFMKERAGATCTSTALIQETERISQTPSRHTNINRLNEQDTVSAQVNSGEQVREMWNLRKEPAAICLNLSFCCLSEDVWMKNYQREISESRGKNILNTNSQFRFLQTHPREALSNNICFIYCSDQINYTYTTLPKVLAPPSNERFDYFSNFHEYKS